MRLANAGDRSNRFRLTLDQQVGVDRCELSPSDSCAGPKTRLDCCPHLDYGLLASIWPPAPPPVPAPAHTTISLTLGVDCGQTLMSKGDARLRVPGREASQKACAKGAKTPVGQVFYNTGGGR